MASTYDPLLGLTEMVPFDPTVKNVWGTILDTNFTLLGQAVTGDNGYAGGKGAGINISGLSSYTLTAVNGGIDQARQLVYPFTGSLSGQCVVTLPESVKLGWAINATTGGQNVVLTSGGGGQLVIPPTGYWYLFYADGAGDVIAQSLALNLGGTYNGGIGAATSTIGTLTITGNSLLYGAVTTASNLTASGAGGFAQNLGVAGASYLGAATLTGNLTVNGTSTLVGPVTLDGATTVAGAANFNGNINVTTMYYFPPYPAPLLVEGTVTTPTLSGITGAKYGYEIEIQVHGNVTFEGEWIYGPIVLNGGTGVLSANPANNPSAVAQINVGSFYQQSTGPIPSSIAGTCTVTGPVVPYPGEATVGLYNGGYIYAPSMLVGPVSGALPTGGLVITSYVQPSVTAIPFEDGILTPTGIYSSAYGEWVGPAAGIIMIPVGNNYDTVAGSIMTGGIFCTSDARIKPVRKQISGDDGVRFVRNVPGMLYKKEAKVGVVSHMEAGYLAQDVLAAGFPEMVMASDAPGMPASRNDAEGPENVRFEMVLAGQVGYLAAALGEALARIDALTARAAKLVAKKQPRTFH